MKLKSTKFQIAMEIVGLLVIIGMILFVSISWVKLPDQIPGHYNIAGEADRWGSKSEIIIPPIMGIILYLFITILSFLPNTWGLPVKVTDKNREQLYEYTRSLLICIKVEILAIFFFTTYNMATAKSMPPVFTLVIVLALIGTAIYFFRRMYQVGKIKTRNANNY